MVHKLPRRRQRESNRPIVEYFGKPIYPPSLYRPFLLSLAGAYAKELGDLLTKEKEPFSCEGRGIIHPKTRVHICDGKDPKTSHILELGVDYSEKEKRKFFLEKILPNFQENLKGPNCRDFVLVY